MVRDSSIGPASPVWIWQRTWEFETLIDLYHTRAPRNVLELGVYDGGTLYHWLTNATPGVHVTAIDPRPVDIPPEWIPAGVSLDLLAMSSDEAVTTCADLGPFDWIFIDADHEYLNVARDWTSYLPLGDGVIALHDILPAPTHANIAVHQLWREIQAAGYVTRELIADVDAEWGGIGVVFL